MMEADRAGLEPPGPKETGLPKGSPTRPAINRQARALRTKKAAMHKGDLCALSLNGVLIPTLDFASAFEV